jgi:hypothetical protein
MKDANQIQAWPEGATYGASLSRSPDAGLRNVSLCVPSPWAQAYAKAQKALVAAWASAETV